MTAPAGVPAPDDGRRELKFVFSDPDVDGLRELLVGGGVRPIRFGPSRVSRVSSLYFDDHRLSSCRESLAGVPRRAKLRLRWYDEPFPTRTAFFELKRRVGMRVHKRRAELAIGSDLQRMDHAELVDRLEREVWDEAAAWLALRGLPTLLVAYRREHFLDPDTGIRITLDYDVEAAGQLWDPGPVREPAERLDGLVVVEVKTATWRPEAVRRLLHPLAPRLARCSKYLRGCQAQGLLPGSDV